MVAPPSSTSPTESTSSGISSQKSNLGLDELIESLSYFVETSNSSSPTGTATDQQRREPPPVKTMTMTMTTPLRSKRELIASMNGTIRRERPGDLDPLSLQHSNHSERNGGVSWSNQVTRRRDPRRKRERERESPCNPSICSVNLSWLMNDRTNCELTY